MNEIIIPKNMQLYWLINDRAIGGVDKIKVNTIAHTMEMHKPTRWESVDPTLVGIINLDDFQDEGQPIEDWLTDANEY